MNTKWQLKDTPKQFTTDLDKTRRPEDTIKAVKARFAELKLDILAEIVRIDNGRLGIPVYFSVCGSDAFRLTGTRKQMGKGATPEQAEASAVMELVERYSFYSFAANKDNFTIGTYGQLRDRALPFDMIAKSVHDDSGDLEAAEAIFSGIPMKWTSGYNLTAQKPVLIPYDWFFTINEFNGTSAGNCREEALCQGICELVERHVSALVSRDRLRVPGIDPETADDPILVELLSKYRKNGIDLYISDFTLEMGIPTVGVLAHDPATFPGKSELVWTAGTTPSPRKAFNRALTEVAQLGGDFNTGSNYVASGLPKFNRLSEAEFITRPDRLLSVHDLPDISDGNFRLEVERCIAALAGKGMNVIGIDTTQPLLGIPALYMIVPGAHFRERAAGGSVGLFAAKLIVDKYSPEKALAELDAIDRRLPGKYYIRFYMGQCRLALSDPEGALTAFQQALDLDPHPQDLPSIYSYMGVCHKEMERYDSALAILEKGADIDSERTDIYNLIGFCHFKRKEHEQAIAAFEQVIRLNPSSAIDYANIATNYRELGDQEKAIHYYQTALRIDPGIDFARENLNNLKKVQG